MLAELLQYAINGLAQGSVYALIALGYTMVYGILKLINFAHSEFYMSGAFFALVAFSTLKIPIPLGVALVLLCTGLLAVGVERIAYRPLRNSNRIAPLITALGVSIVLPELCRIIMGPEPREFPQLFENDVYDLSFIHASLEGVLIQKTQLVIFGVTCVLMILLRYIVKHTKIGRAMRALSFDFDASLLMGVPLNRVIAFTFFLGASLAAVGGMLIGMYQNQIDPYMGQLAGLKAFTAAVLGGIGVVPGAVVGALLLGLSEAFVVGYGQSSYRDAIAFGILIVVLLIRPWGIMGSPERVKV